MRDYAKGNLLNNLNVKLHNILFTNTIADGYEEQKYILLTDIEGIAYDEYLLLEGGHCSCYGFDETEWYATVYEEDELINLASAEYNKKSLFWKMVKKYFE